VWKINVVVVVLLVLFDVYRFMGLDGNSITRYNDVLISILAVVMVMLYVVRKLKFLPILIAIHFLSSFIDLLVSGFFITALSIDIQDIMTNPLHRTIITLPSILIFTILGYLLKHFKLEISHQSLGRKELSLMAMTLLTFGFYVTSIQVFGNTNSGNTMGQFANLMAMVGGMAVIYTVLTLIIKDNRLKKVEDLRSVQEEIIVQQQLHHQVFLKREEETKKFRHDISQHLIAMLALLEKEDYQKLERYVADLNDDAIKIQTDTGIDTGSSVVNAILFSLRTEYGESSINLKWRGRIPEEIKIPDKDISILFINLLKNAFEATSICLEDKCIEVRINVTDNSFYLMIKNSYTGERLVENENFRTTKENPKNHGYGLKIVQDVVKKYDGQIHFSDNVNEFIIEITFVGDIYPS